LNILKNFLLEKVGIERILTSNIMKNIVRVAMNGSFISQLENLPILLLTYIDTIKG
jgi:hypothetical protein